MNKYFNELEGENYKVALEYLKNIFKTEKNIVILCIGTDRACGDCLGPYLGTKLSDNDDFKYPIYGTLEKPIHAKNLTTKLNQINSLHPDSFIIGIDACLGEKNHVGYIGVRDKALNPGVALNKQLPKVGNLSIIGIVNEDACDDIMNFSIMQNTRLYDIITLANKICTLLLECI